MQWITKLWRKPKPRPTPVLLRVEEPTGAAPAEVQLEVTWFPSQKRFDRECMTAAGLCVLPWYGEEDRAELVVRVADATATVEVRRDRPDRGRVLNLKLSH